MSWYGITLHGQSTYGLPNQTLPIDPLPGPGAPAPTAQLVLPVNEYDVQPFLATPVGFDHILLTWKPPGGQAWDEMKIVRNKTGYPADITDGDLLLDTTGSVSNLIDANVSPGRWHYYAMFLHISGSWVRAAVTVTLMVRDYQYGTTMYSLVPEYYRLTLTPGDDVPSTENVELQKFLKVLGLGFDNVKTWYDALLNYHNADTNSLDQLRLLANQFGIDYNAAIPARLFRQRVRNAGTLAQEKGTLAGIRTAATLATGWDVAVSTYPNILLNDDRSRLLHPSYPKWDSSMNYAAGERVVYSGYLYEAKTGGAYGTAQVPSGTPADNTWWYWRSGYSISSNTDADGYVAGYEPYNFTTGSTVASASQVAIGLQSPLDTTNYTGNVWAVSNATGATADLGLRAISRASGASTVDPERAIFMGDPLPRPALVYSATQTYQVGDIVYYGNQHYKSLAVQTGVAPPGDQVSNSAWDCLGIDERFLLFGSVYVKGANTSYPTYMLIDYYDEHGSFIGTIDDSVDQTNVKFDSFTGRTGELNARTVDVGSGAWAATAGAWTVSDQFGGVALPKQVGIANAARVTSVSDIQISVTFFNPTSAGNQSVLFRYSDNSNYWYASRTALVKVAAGVVTSTNHSTAFGDGDRITLTLSGSSITVLRNGTQVNSATDTFNSTATQHGLAVI